MKQVYDVTRKDGQWYVIGYCGRGKTGRQQWMALSSACPSKALAVKEAQRLYRATVADRVALYDDPSFK